jgi:hypothetical protein
MPRTIFVCSFVAAIFVITTISCNELTPKEEIREVIEEDYFANCKYNSPIPVFSTNINGVSTHSFELQARQAVEKVVFDVGLVLTIYQRGCNEIEQYFEFTVSGKFETTPDEQWVRQAGQYFYYIGGLDEQYLPLYEWGELMMQYAPSAKLGNDFEPYPEFFIQVTTKVFNDHTLLIVRLATTAAGLE